MSSRNRRRPADGARPAAEAPRPRYAGPGPKKPKAAKAPAKATTGRAAGPIETTGPAGPHPADPPPPSSANRARLHRTVTGVALLAAPLLLLAAQLLLASISTKGGSGPLAVIGANAGLWRAANTLLLVRAMLLVPIALGLAHLLRERGPVWADVGAGLTIAGASAAIALVVLQLVVGQIAALGADGRLATLFDRLAPLNASLEDLEDMAQLGLVLLALGLHRARLAPAWAPALLLAGLALPLSPVWLAVAACVLQVAGMGWIGLTVLRLDAGGWATPPEHPPFPKPAWLAGALTVLFVLGGVSAARFLALVAVFIALVVYRPRPGRPAEVSS
jgi:hypothetical protein